MTLPLCLNTSTIKPQPLLEKIRLVGEAGFPAIELWLNDIYEHVGRGGEVRDVEHALADHGLVVPSCIALRAWAEASDEEYPLLLDEARRRLELCRRLGARWLVCSPPREPCPVEQIVARYADLLALGREVGVRPTFEYISSFRSIARLDQAWEVVQAVDDPDATVIVDAFHTWNSGSSPETLERIPGERISHYHIDDADPTLPAGAQRDPHRVLPGDGPLDLAGELRVLWQVGYRGYVSLELFNAEWWARDPREVLRLGKERLEALLSEALG